VDSFCSDLREFLLFTGEQKNDDNDFIGMAANRLD